MEDYQHPHLGRALWQCANTLGPILGIWIALYFLKDASWLLTIALAALAGLFLVRAFIIFHDCGHGSFFKNKKANDALGFFTGMLTFTPYHHWKWEHAVHHATNGDLDKRGIGDVWTMTVEEYLTSSRRIKLSYRLLRNPFILFGLAPLFLFFVLERFPSSQCKPARTQIRLPDEPYPTALWYRHEYDLWLGTLSYFSDHHDGRGRRMWNLAVLCSASIRGYLLGTR